MKINRKRVLIHILVAVAIMACEKEVEVNDSFGFTVEEAHAGNGFVFEGIENKILVIPERNVEGTQYSFKYSTNGLKGHFEGSGGQIYEALQVYGISELDLGINYIPEETGEHEVTMEISDNKGNVKELYLDYDIIRAPFSFIVSKTDGQYIINSPKDLNFTLSRVQGAGLEEPFKLSYFLDGGTADFIDGKDGRVTKIKEDSIFLVGNGTYRYSYIPKTLGEHIVHASAMAPDGEVRTTGVTLDVGHLPFNWAVTSQSNQVDVGEQTSIALNLTNEDPESDISYEYFFEYGPETVGTVELLETEGEDPITMGKWSSISLGNHNYLMSSEDIGKKNLRFTIRDSYGQTKMDSVVVDVQTIPLTFRGSPEASNIFINQKTTFNFELTPKGHPGDITYALSYDRTIGDGKIYQDGKLLEPGIPHAVLPGSFSYEFTPTSLGEHDILFSVTDSNGQEVESTITVNSRNIDLNFSASPAKSTMLVKNSNMVGLSLIENNDYQGVSYELSYFITGGTGTLYDDQGEEITASSYFDFGTGQDTFEFVPTVEGNFVLTFLLRDSNGQILETTVPIRVDSTDFTFAATQGENTIALGNKVDINLSITANNGENDATYQMYYETDGNGTLQFAGEEYAPGAMIPLTEMVSTAIYTPSMTGTHELTFTVKDSNGVNKSDGASVTVNNGTFSFSVASSPSKLLVGETSNLNMYLAQDITNPLASYSMSYEIEGDDANILDGSGNKVEPGVFILVEPGNFSWSFDSQHTGAYGLEFTIRDNTGMQAVDNVVLEVNGNSFDLTASAATPTAKYGTGIPVNLNISEAVSGTGETYLLRFASDMGGHIAYNGNEYSAGESISVPTGDFQMEYFADVKGVHGIAFTVVSSNGSSDSEEISLNFDPIDFNFTVAPQDNTIDHRGTTSINFDVSDTNGGSGYEMRFVVTDGNASVMDGSGNSLSSGTYHPIGTGSFSWGLKGDYPGDIEIEFFARNSSGTEKNGTLHIEVIPQTYTFDAVAQGGSFNVDGSANISFNLNESGIGGESYTLFYSTDNEGVLTYGGSSISPGTSVSITPGNTNATYTGFQGGGTTWFSL